MVFTSRAGLRSSRAARTPTARWSGRTSASAPFTLPMGVRHASTTNTELTLTSRASGLYSLKIRHSDAAPGGCRGPHRYLVLLVTRVVSVVTGAGHRVAELVALREDIAARRAAR